MRQLDQDLPQRVNLAALVAHAWETLPQHRAQAGLTIRNHQHGRLQSTGCQVVQQTQRSSGGLATVQRQMQRNFLPRLQNPIDTEHAFLLVLPAASSSRSHSGTDRRSCGCSENPALLHLKVHLQLTTDLAAPGREITRLPTVSRNRVSMAAYESPHLHIWGAKAFPRRL